MIIRASVSQSVERMVRILTLFETERRPLTRAAIAETLAAPRSSVAALLQGMTELHILSLDRASRTYFPTALLSRLTSWLDPLFSVPPSLQALMSRLQQATHETVTLVAPLAQALEVISVEPGLHPISYGAYVGQTVPIWASAVGNAYLSVEPDKAIAGLHRRAVATASDAWPAPGALAGIMESVRKARRDGYSLFVGSVASDAATIAVAVPRHDGGRASAIALSGPSSRIVANETELVRILRLEMSSLAAATAPRQVMPVKEAKR